MFFNEKGTQQNYLKYLNDSSVFPLSAGPPIVPPSKVATGHRQKATVLLVGKMAILPKHKGSFHRPFWDSLPPASFLRLKNVLSDMEITQSCQQLLEAP